MSGNTLFAVVSGPLTNEPQVVGHAQITDFVKNAGFDILDPSGFGGRAAFISEADLLVVWLDSILPKGEFLYHIKDPVHDGLTVPLPENVMALMAAGLQATGQAKIKPKTSGLIVPGRDDPRGIEIENVPTVFHVTSPGGVFGQLIGKGAKNTPDPLVTQDIGIASCRGIPVVGVRLAGSDMDSFLCDFIIRDFLELGNAFEDVFSSFENGNQGDISNLQKKYDRKERKKTEKIEKEAEKLSEEDKE